MHSWPSRYTEVETNRHEGEERQWNNANRQINNQSETNEHMDREGGNIHGERQRSHFYTYICIQIYIHTYDK